MKDLKYLYEFEKLLESANNPLVQQACAEGKHALAYTCYHMPEVLLNTGDCFSVRLRAPLTGSLDISSSATTASRCWSAASRAATTSCPA